MRSASSMLNMPWCSCPGILQGHSSRASPSRARRLAGCQRRGGDTALSERSHAKRYGVHSSNCVSSRPSSNVRKIACGRTQGTRQISGQLGLVTRRHHLGCGQKPGEQGPLLTLTK